MQVVPAIVSSVSRCEGWWQIGKSEEVHTRHQGLTKLTGAGTFIGTAGNALLFPLPRSVIPSPPGSVIYPSIPIPLFLCDPTSLDLPFCEPSASSCGLGYVDSGIPFGLGGKLGGPPVGDPGTGDKSLECNC